MACFTRELVALSSCMVYSCFIASIGVPHRGSQAACLGKATKPLLLAHPSTPGGQSLSRFCSYQRPCRMKNHILTIRGNILHASPPAAGTATVCSSSTIPRVPSTVSPAQNHAVPRPIGPELPTPQPRPGVPVYVMLPLDTVSLWIFACQLHGFTTFGLMQAVYCPCR